MKLLLIDGSNLIFRGYYATERQNIVTPAGLDANAIHTLVGMINKMIIEHKPTHIFIGLDTGSSTFRHKMYADYKGKRSATPERLKVQFPMAKELYEAMGIKYDATEEFEADDLIATYANLAKNQGYEVLIVSGDKDLLQLIDDNVRVLTPAMGFAKEVNYNEEVFVSKFEFPPHRFIEYKALVGDSSDNIIGVEKLGDKTARKLINEYDSISDMVQAAKDGTIKNKVGENLAKASEVVEENVHLVTLIEDCEVGFNLEDLEFNNYNFTTLLAYMQKCGFTKYYNQFSKNVEIKKIVLPEYSIIEKFDVDVHVGEETFIYTQTLEDNYLISESLGFGLLSVNGIFYLPFEKVDDSFISFLQSDKKKITYNLKRLMGSLKLKKANGFVFDIYLGSSLLSGENFKKSIDLLAVGYGVNLIANFEEIYKAKSNPVMPDLNLLARDIVTKVMALEKLYLPIINQLEEYQLSEVFYDIELPLTMALSRMELCGVYIDEKKLDELNSYYSQKIDVISKEISLITDININSPKQLSDYLFVDLELPNKGIKKTTKNFSTDVDNLNKLKDMLLIDLDTYANVIKLIDLILEYRIYSKLNSTYLLGIKKYVKNGMINPIYQQLLAETGRLSAMDPSIQNIPIRTMEGQVIRSLFNANDGYDVVAIDYSQVELRLISSIANEENMIHDFKNGLDIHSETAKKILGLDSVTSEQRSKAKAINFGIIYGMSQYGLAKQVGISNGEAKEFIAKYFETYPMIQNYMNEQIKFAQEHGYVKTLLNRRRYIKNINSSNRQEKENAERMAINSPIQGTAADLIKIAMIRIDNYIYENDLDIRMVMQIHDELVFYVKSEKVEEVSQELCRLMENLIDLKVSIKAEIGYGKNWLESK
ncbi:MAG: DNA polymerase I [Mycoplasmatales bacterium]